MIDVGDGLPLSVNTADTTGAPANVGTMTLTIMLPNQTTVQPAVTNPTVGTYTAAYTAVQPGQHVATWTATGANAASFVNTYNVNGTIPAISMYDFKSYLNKSQTTTTDDEELREFLVTATSLVAKITGQPVGVKVCTDTFNSYASSITLTRRPVLSITSVTAQLGDWPTVLPTDLQFDPYSGVVFRSDLMSLAGAYTIVYKAGRTDVPPHMLNAVKALGQHLWQSQLNVQGGRPQLGGGDDYMQTAGYAIPNRVMEMLQWDRDYGIA